MLERRVLTAVVGIPLLLWVVWQGGIIFTVFFGVVIALMLKEYFAMLKNRGIQGMFYLSLLIGFLFTVFPLFTEHIMIGEIMVFLLISSFLIQVIFPHKYSIGDTAATVLGTLYVCGLFSYIFLLRSLENGAILVITLFITVWLCDTGAYFIGLSLGRHKLAPKVSPKKTIEGAVGGIITGSLGILLINMFWLYYPVLSVLGFGVLICISAQLGDLAESIIKRNVGVKDSGNLLPGHGGMLDRFDSILFSAPVFYYAIMYLL